MMHVWTMTDKVWPKTRSYAGAERGNSPWKPTDVGSQFCFIPLFLLQFRRFTAEHPLQFLQETDAAL